MTETYPIRTSSKQDDQFIIQQLIKYNLRHVSIDKEKRPTEIGFHIKDSDGNVIAGVNGLLYWGQSCLQINHLWVDQRVQNRGLGTKLLLHIEREAKKCGVHLSHLTTYSFQSKRFYIKNGYEIFGVLDDCPKGHQRYYLKKYL